MKEKKPHTVGNFVSKKMIVSLITIIALISITAIVFLPGNAAAGPDSQGLPAYALGSERIKEAYLFALDNSSALNGIPCHCGCMQMPHAGRIHSRGLLDCFINPDGTFDPHGSTCPQCVDDTLTVKNLTLEGISKSQIIAVIDAKYPNG